MMCVNSRGFRTFQVLATLTDLHRDELKKTQFSYEQLVLCVFGPRVGQVFSYIIVLTQFGSLTAYWVILLVHFPDCLHP